MMAMVHVPVYRTTVLLELICGDAGWTEGLNNGWIWEILR